MSKPISLGSTFLKPIIKFVFDQAIAPLIADWIKKIPNQDVEKGVEEAWNSIAQFIDKEL